jgi:hypothetical protein
MRRSGDGCASSAITLKSAIEEAIYAKAPEILEIKIEDAVALESPRGGTGWPRVALPLLHR